MMIFKNNDNNKLLCILKQSNFSGICQKQFILWQIMSI